MDSESAPVHSTDDGDIKSPKGTLKKIVGLLATLIVVGAAVAVYYFLVYQPEQARKATLQTHKDFWAEFTGAHATGYGASWKCIFGGTEENQIDSNLKLETLVEAAISQNETMFGKLVMACMDADKETLADLKREPIPGMVGMAEHVKALDEMKVPKEYAEKFEGVSKTVEAVDSSWKNMGEYFEGADERAKWDKKLTDVSTNGWGTLWVKAQKGEKFTPTDLGNAWRYYKFMTCSLGKDYTKLGEFKNMQELEGLVGKIAVDGECSTEEKATAHFQKIDECGKKFLLAGKPDLEDPEFQNAIKNNYYNEQRSLAAIAGSFEGEMGIIHEGCIGQARTYTKATDIGNLFKALMAYTTARVELGRIYQDQKAKYEKK